MKKLPSNLKKKIFWDANLKDIDIDKNKNDIISRILMYGDDSAFNFLFNTYDKKTIYNTLITDKQIDKITRNYWKTAFEKKSIKI